MPTRRHLPIAFLLIALFVAPVAGCQSDDAAAPEAAPSAADAVGDTADAAGSDAEEPVAATDAESSDADGGQPATTDVEAEAPLITEAAVVNGEPIPLSEFQRQAFDTQRFFVDRGVDPNTAEGQRELLYVRRQVLDDMIDQALLDQAATEMGITVDDEEVQAGLAAYADEEGATDLDTLVEQAGTTMDEVMAMERASLVSTKVLDRISADVATTAAFVHARHLLCDTEAACADSLARIEAGEEFADIAREVSRDPSSAERGGDLDWVAQGMMTSQEVEAALFALEPGERSGVVQTDLGFHVFEVLERDPSRTLTERQRYTLKEKRLLEWLAERRDAATIEVLIEDLRDLGSG